MTGYADAEAINLHILVDLPEMCYALYERKAEFILQTKSSNDFISNREWLASATQNDNLILRGVSALEYLQLFTGYCGEVNIDVYAQAAGMYSNIQYHIVDNFDIIDYFRHNDVLCSTPNQAINDILSDPDGDIQALVEALSRYYHTHNESFDGLQVRKNKVKFEEMQTWAKNHYCDCKAFEND